MNTARESSLAGPPRRDTRAGAEGVGVAILVGSGRELPGYRWPASLIRILGRSPLQRHLFHLARLGVRRCIIVLDTGRLAPEVEEECRRQLAGIPIGGMDVVVRDAGAPEATGAAWPERERVLVVRSEAVYDPRMYEWVRDWPRPVRIVERCREGAAEGAERLCPIGLAKLDAAALPEFWSHIPSAELAEASEQALGLVPSEVVLLDELPVYIPDLRRRLRPYACVVRGAEDLERAGRLILDSAQKGVLDFPARFLHPPAENLLASWLSRTSVTPNQITVLTGLLGFAASLLFATQAFAWGLVIALLTNVLDGVDGKLARVKLLASRLGDRLDHILDVSFEFSWYVGLGWGLFQATGRGLALLSGPALVGVMMACRAVSGIYKLRTGRQIHDHRPFDRGFRLVAGRRNVYVMILLAGLLVGRLEGAFYISFGWGVLTLLVYMARVFVALAPGSAGGRSHPNPGAADSFLLSSSNNPKPGG